MRRQFDLAAVCALVEQTRGLSVVAGETNIARVVRLSETLAPRAILLDASFPKSGAIVAAHYLLAKGAVRAAAILDNSYVLARAVHTLRYSTCKYVTRDHSITQVRDLFSAVLLANPDHAPNASVQVKSDELALALAAHDPFGILKLSLREREVMVYLASGRTIAETAVELGLAHSTVDNHKSRLMKRLNVHRIADLMRIALSAGFVEFDDADSGNGQIRSTQGPPRPHIVLGHSLSAR